VAIIVGGGIMARESMDGRVMAIALVHGPLRVDPEAPAMMLGNNPVEIGRGWIITAYYLGVGLDNSLWAVPLTQLLYQEGIGLFEHNDPNLKALVESYQPGASTRSPRQAASVRIPEGDISTDYVVAGSISKRLKQIMKAIKANRDKVHVDRLQEEMQIILDNLRPRSEPSIDDGIPW
jgi:hypothetical protein